MHYLFKIIKAGTYDHEKSTPFAPFVKELINHVVRDQTFVMDTNPKAYKPKKELSMFDPKNLQASKQKLRKQSVKSMMVMAPLLVQRQLKRDLLSTALKRS
jgi:hypothetical protein